MIKLIISELMFNDYPRRASVIEHKDVFINTKLIESVRAVEHVIFTFKGEYACTTLGYIAIPESSSNVSFYELTMSSGVKYLTMEKLDFIEGFGEIT